MNLRLSLVAVVLCLLPVRASAFKLRGHEIIEAVAYRRLLRKTSIPVGDRRVSGRQIYLELVARGVLDAPKCLDPEQCPDLAAKYPVALWPPLRSGEQDLVMARQLSVVGQCYHFMAHSKDVWLGPSARNRELSQWKARLRQSGTAYDRCIDLLGHLLHNIVSPPANVKPDRYETLYAVMHSIEDSYSTAHVERDEKTHDIEYLKPWRLRSWLPYVFHWQGLPYLFTPTHHAVFESRDDEYMKWDVAGENCRELYHPYAVPEDCLTPNASLAADAVVDLLVLVYSLFQTTVPDAWITPNPSLKADALVDMLVFAYLILETSKFESEFARQWHDFDRVYLPLSPLVPAHDPPPAHKEWRPDYIFGAGVRYDFTSDAWEVRAQARRQLAGPLPFLWSGGIDLFYRREGQHDGGGAEIDIASLELPIDDHFVFGFSIFSAGYQYMDAGYKGLIAHSTPLRLEFFPIEGMWVSITGPRWSWSDERFHDDWMLSIGYAGTVVRHVKRKRRAGTVGPTWPPKLWYDYSTRRWDVSLVGAAGVDGSRDNQYFSAGVVIRYDRDRWGRRAGFGFGPRAWVFSEDLDGYRYTGARFDLAESLFLIPDLLSIDLIPVVLGAGWQWRSAKGWDARSAGFRGEAAFGELGATLFIGRLEVGIESRPLVYTATLGRTDEWFQLRAGWSF